MKGKLLHMVSNIQRPAMNKLKTIFLGEKIFDNESTSTISTNYSQDKNTHFLLFLNWNFYFLFVVTLIVVILRSHFYYTAAR